MIIKPPIGNPCWPLIAMPGSKGVHYPIPTYGNKNGWLAVRKYDIHLGIDLFADEDDIVVSMYDGEIFDFGKFTSSEETPWWNDTDHVSIMSKIDGECIIIVYGEIEVHQSHIISIGDKVPAGTVLGKVKSVIKRPKPGQHPSMLHLEMHNEKYRTPYTLTHHGLLEYYKYIYKSEETVWVSAVHSLLDPTDTILAAKANHEKNSLYNKAY